jgi:hypothetical protein
MANTLTTTNPLEIKIYPSGDLSLIAGRGGKIAVTVINRGQQSAVITISVAQSPELVLRWFKTTEHRLALPAKEKGEVSFDLEIPPDIIPEDYDYLLTIDAPQDYPEDTPILYPGKLQISPFVQESRSVNDPIFTVAPLTSSLEAKTVKPGDTVEFKATIHNRSNRVDRFRLSFLDLEDNWDYKIDYPEGINLPGLIAAVDGLELNPGEKGEVTIYLTPPKEALAGIYSPTIRLYSENFQKQDQTELALLDLVYLELEAVYSLDVQFNTKIGRVRQESGLFELRFNNQGNTQRFIQLKAASAEGDPLCTYSLSQDVISLFPGQTGTVELTITPPQSSWKRPFMGRFFNFYLDLEDQEKHPLSNNHFQGILVWESRPQWQLWLLIFSGLLTITGLLILILWLLFRPKPVPRIVDFTSENNLYQEVKSDRIRLNWQVNQPQHLRSLQVVGLSPDGKVISEPVIYDFSEGIPSALAEFCIQKRALVCRNVPTDAKQPGDYIFELTIFPKDPQKEAIILKTNTISIQPAPLPEITDFGSVKPVYQEEKQESIGLKLTINHPDQLKQLELIGTNANNPDYKFRKIYALRGNLVNQAELCEVGQKDCVPIPCKIGENGMVICDYIPTDAKDLGDYVFGVNLIPKKSVDQPLESVQTSAIKIAPIPLEIVSFQVNNAAALPNYSLRINPLQPPILTVSWQVKGGANTKVELLPSPGTVQLNDSITLNLGTNPIKETITLQVTDDKGQKISRSFLLETFIEQLPTVDLVPPPVSPPPRELPVFDPSPIPTPPVTASDGSDPSGTKTSTPQEGASPPKSSQPPGASPPLPPGKDFPLPAELPPQLH